MADNQINEFIKTALAQGKTKEDIYLSLLGRGVKVEEIQNAFSQTAPQTTKDGKAEKEDLQKKTVKIFLTVGAVLIGAGIFSFIAANWQGMSREVKVLLIVAGMLLSYGIGWYEKEKMKLSKTGEAFLFLGTILYGAGIFLVGQMFNIRAGWPDGFIFWMFGSLALAWAADALSIYYLAIPVGIAAFGGIPFGALFGFRNDLFLFSSDLLLFAAAIILFYLAFYSQKGRTEKAADPSIFSGDFICQMYYLLSACFLYAALWSFNNSFEVVLSWQGILLFVVVLAFFCSYYLRASYLALFGMIGSLTVWSAQICDWMGSSCNWWEGRFYIFIGWAFLGLIFYIAGRIYENRGYQPFSTFYQVLSLLLITGLILYFSSINGLINMHNIDNANLIILSFLLLAMAAAAAIIYTSVKKIFFDFEAVALYFLFIIFVALLCFPDPSAETAKVEMLYVYIQAILSVVLNIAAFFVPVGIVYLGFLKKEEGLISFGVRLVLLSIIVKYFTWFFTFLEKSAFFIGAGIILLGAGALMELGRRKIVSRIQAEGKNENK